MITVDKAKGICEINGTGLELAVDIAIIVASFCESMLETYSRNQCRRTGEYIIDTRFTTGRYCPLNFTDKGENT